MAGGGVKINNIRLVGGANGLTPTFKIENGNLYNSYDNGSSWSDLGQVVGANGDDGQQGKGLNPRGSWQLNTTYQNNSDHIDIVEYDGDSYYCTTTVTDNTPPSSSPYWRIFVEGGTAGEFYFGEGVTGTSTTPQAFPYSGVNNATVGDVYWNTSNTSDQFNLYKCTFAGDALTAKWAYFGNVKGAQGIQGPIGPAGSGQNPNLIINPEFSVNQRGITSISSGRGYMADCWYKISGGNYFQMAISDNELTIIAKSNGVGAGWQRIFGQVIDIPKGLRGKTVTFSINCKTTEGVYYAMQIQSVNENLVVISNSTARTIDSIGRISNTWTIPSDASYIMCSIVANLDNVTLDVPLTTKEWKLEVGDTYTEYTPPLYVEELEKCKRYLYALDNKESGSYPQYGIVFGGGGTPATNARMIVFNSFRIKPTILTNGTFSIRANGSSFAVNGFSVQYFGTNKTTIRMELDSDLADGTCGYIQGNSADSKIFLDSSFYMS